MCANHMFKVFVYHCFIQFPFVWGSSYSNFLEWNSTCVHMSELYSRKVMVPFWTMIIYYSDRIHFFLARISIIFVIREQHHMFYSLLSKDVLSTTAVGLLLLFSGWNHILYIFVLRHLVVKAEVKSKAWKSKWETKITKLHLNPNHQCLIKWLQGATTLET